MGCRNFGRIASLLHLKSIVIGSRGDMEIAEKVVRASGGKAISMAGSTSLKELIELMRNARLVISNDSGPMHIAAGFNVPVFCDFRTDQPAEDRSVWKGTYNNKKRSGMRPVLQKKCSDLRCMNGITVEQVMRESRLAHIIHKFQTNLHGRRRDIVFERIFLPTCLPAGRYSCSMYIWIQEAKTLGA